MNAVWHDIDQNSDEWLLIRSGKITSSSLNKVMANFGKSFGEPAKKYAVDIALSQISGVIPSNNYNNEHMERGHEEEPIARIEYENQYFCEVTNGGFFELDDFGDSPDGLVGNDGLAEIKSAIPSVHYSRITKGKYDSQYKWQIVGHLKASNREWVDFISYCSQFPNEKKLFVHRSYREDFNKEFEMLDIRLDEFRELIRNTKYKIMNCDYSIGLK